MNMSVNGIDNKIKQNKQIVHCRHIISFYIYILHSIKGRVSDSNNIFLWHESENINKKKKVTLKILVDSIVFTSYDDYVH